MHGPAELWLCGCAVLARNAYANGKPVSQVAHVPGSSSASDRPGLCSRCQIIGSKPLNGVPVQNFKRGHSRTFNPRNNSDVARFLERLF